MNRKHLLAALRAKGYKGKAELAEIKSFLLEQGGDPETIKINGESLKVDEIFQKTATLEASVEDDEPKAEQEVETKAAKQNSDDAPGFGYRANPGLKSMFDGGSGEDEAPKAFTIRSDRERAVKAYDHRVARASELPTDKRPAFKSGEEAEVFTAFMRQATTGFGRIGYKMARTDREILAKAQVDFDNSLGGVAVPTYWANQLIWLTEQYGVALKLANVQRMSSDKGVYPRKTSIAAMTASAEGVAKTQTDMGFDGVTLNCKEASNIYLASYQWYEDANINVADVIASSFAESAARRIDLDYFQGDGTATYNNNVGLVGKLTGNRVASATNWASQTQADHNNMLGLLEYVNSNRVRFAGSRQHFYRVCNRLQASASQFMQLVGPARDGAERSYLDLPYHFAQVNWEVPSAAGLVPHTNSGTYNLFAGDFEGGSMIGIRDELRILFSDQYKFAEGLLAWRGTMRYDINIHLSGRSSETYGPIVALKNS